MLTHTKKAERHPEAEYKASAGRVFWITGLSGTGKTTLGRELWGRLRAAGRPATFLDGDALRSVIAEDLGHSADDRRRSAMRNARLSRLLAEQGTDVVCATISLFHEVHRWNRENIPGYREIYLRVPIDELRRRDSKGIYSGAQRGDVRHVVGLDVPAEVPEAPDLVLDNYGALDIATAVDRILTECDKRDENPAAANPGVPSASRPRRKLSNRSRRCYTMPAFSRKSDSRSAIGARDPLACSLPLPLRPGVQDRDRSCAAVHGARTAPQIPRPASTIPFSDVRRSRSSGIKSIGGSIDSSFADDATDADQIFVQPMLEQRGDGRSGFLAQSPAAAPIS